MESSTAWVIFGAFGVVGGSILAYVLIMIFWPEWVGITGNVARKAEESHKEGTSVDDHDVFKGPKT